MHAKNHDDRQVNRWGIEELITIFLVHLHLDVVPEVLLMVGMIFLSYKSPILLS